MEHKLLAGSLMPDSSKGRGQMKCSPWSSRLRVGHGTNNPNPKNVLLIETSESGGGQDPNRVVVPAVEVEEKKKKVSVIHIIQNKICSSVTYKTCYSGSY
jgi:hypothetical protein